MKKIFAALLTMIIIVTLASCKNNVAPEDVRGEQTSVTDSSTASQAQSSAATSTNASKDGASSAASSVASKPQSSQASSSTASKPEFSLGNTKGLVYENKFIGIGCSLDSGWSFYTDEQIKQLNNVASDMAGDAYKEAIKNAQIIYDMFATSSNQLDSININLEKLSALQLAALDITKNYDAQFPTIKQAYENMGYSNIFYETKNISIGSKKIPAMCITAEINGIKLYQKTFSIKCNGYLANASITTYNEDLTEQLISKFYLVK